jgi:hypothetical protein
LVAQHYGFLGTGGLIYRLNRLLNQASKIREFIPNCYERDVSRMV